MDSFPENPEAEYYNPNPDAHIPDEYIDAPFDPIEDAPVEIQSEDISIRQARERFLNEYMNVPAGLTREEIESHPAYQRDFIIFKKINHFLWSFLISELIEKYNFGFESFVHKGSDFVSIYDKFGKFLTTDKLISNTLNTIETMKSIKQGKLFTPGMQRVLSRIYEVVKYDELKDYINEFLQIDEFKNNFRGKFLLNLDMELDIHASQVGYEPVNLIYYISTGNHVLILVYYRGQIVLFDPSYNEEREGEYLTYIKLLNLPSTGRNPIIVRLNVQNDLSRMVDLYCQAWCIHFLYYYIILNTDVDTYVQMFSPPRRDITPETYIREIRLFMLGLTEVTSFWKDMYYQQKYLKYKQKYLNLKKIKL